MRKKLRLQDDSELQIAEDGIPRVEGEGFHDIGFVIKVEMLKDNIPRGWATTELQSRMKFRGATVEVTGLKKDIEDLLAAEGNVDIEEKLIEDSFMVFEAVIRKHVNDIQLEKLVKWYMERIGADRVKIPPRNERWKEDGADADVIAEFDALGLVILVQVKKHSGKTDDWSVTQIRRYKEQQNDKNDGDNDTTYVSWVITTAEEYTLKAHQQAKEQGIRLIADREFVRMLLKAGIKDIGDAIR